MKRLLLLGVSVLLLGMDTTVMAGSAESKQQPGYPESYTQSPFSHFIPGQVHSRLAGRIGFSIHIPINGYHGGAISLHSYPGYGYRHHRSHYRGYYRYRPHSYYRAYKPHRYRPHRYQPFYYRPHHHRPHHHKPWRFRKHDYYQGGQRRHYDGSYYRAERRYRNHEGYRAERRRRDWQ